MLAAEAGSPAGTVEVVKGIVANMGGSSDSEGLKKAEDRAEEAEKKEEQAGAGAGGGDRLAAETAAEVADTAKLLDKSKTSTPVPA